MTPEEKSLLERTYRMSEENNEILRKMRRANRFSTALRVVYWVAIIGLGLGAYYVIQPYLMSAANIISEGQRVIQSFSPR